MQRFLTTLTALLALGLAACDNGGGGRGGAGTQTWKFAIEEIDGSVQDAYAERFKQLIETRSRGRIKVEIYPYGTLGTSAQITELTQSGAVQFTMASPGHLGSVVPEVQIFSIHFLFAEDESVNHRILGGNPRLRELLDAAYRERQLVFLDAFQEGWMAWTANQPIRRPADFAGVKIRVMNSPLLLKAYEAYGANPTTMAYSEIYSALQLNMIDAQVNPVFAIEEMSFYEVQDYLIFPRHLPFIATLTANPAFYDGLPDADRKLVDEVIHELHGYIFGVQRRLNSKRLDVITGNSDIQVIELTAEDRAAFRAAALPVREAYVGMAGERGRQLLETISAAVAQAEAAGRRDAAAE